MSSIIPSRQKTIYELTSGALSEFDWLDYYVNDQSDGMGGRLTRKVTLADLRRWADPTSEAALATVDLGAINAAFVQITGPGTVTSFGSTPHLLMFIIGSGGPVIEDGAIDCPDGIDLTLSAELIYIVRSNGAGRFRIYVASGGSSSGTNNATTKTASYTLNLDDYLVRFNASGGACVATVPDASLAQGHTYVVKKIDSGFNSVTLFNGVNTFDGQASLVLPAQYFRATVFATNGQYDVLSFGNPGV